MSVDDLSPEIKGIVPIVSKKIRMSYAEKVHGKKATSKSHKAFKKTKGPVLPE